MRVELHPLLSVHLYLKELHNVDLSARGYYQVRIVPRPSTQYVADIRLCEKNVPAVESRTAILPATVTHGVAVSSTVEVTFIDEVLRLDDSYTVSIQLPAQSDFRKTIVFSYDLELWSMDRHRPPRFELFEMDSRRRIDVELHMTRLVSAARSVFFEFSAPAVLTMSLFASLISILPRRRKPPPDPQLSPKLSSYHHSVCSTLLQCIRSMELFILRHTKLLSTSISTVPTDCPSELNMLSAHLSSSERPWATLEAEAVQLSSRSALLFSQFIQLFSRSEALFRIMHTEYHEWRLRILGEAFLFSEKPVDQLLAPTITSLTELAIFVSRSKYLQKIPRCALFCAATDCPSESIPIIFEDNFIPLGITGTSTTPVSTVSGNSPISAQSNGLCNGSGDVVEKTYQDDSKTMRLLRFRRKSEEAGHSWSTRKALRPRHSAASMSCAPALVSKLEGLALDDNRPLSSDTSLSRSLDSPHSTLYLDEPNTEDMHVLVDFVKQREVVKSHLDTLGYDACLYSELACSLDRMKPPLFGSWKSNTTRVPMSHATSHLVVFVHGLEGTSEDLAPYRNALRISAPNTGLHFLMSQSNHMETWTDFECMGRNLLREVLEYVTEYMSIPPSKISFIAHSLGGVIVRAALGLPEAEQLYPRLHTFLTINSPHLGLAYVGRGVSWGVHFVQWWKRSRSIEQLSLRDAISFTESYLYKLSRNGVFGRFTNVLLVGALNDVFVPSHSALLESCKSANKDMSALGSAYRDMLASIHAEILNSSKLTRVVRYSVFHNLNSARSNKITGRAAHIAAVEDDIFIEKLFAVSALHYFI